MKSVFEELNYNQGFLCFFDVYIFGLKGYAYHVYAAGLVTHKQ